MCRGTRGRSEGSIVATVDGEFAKPEADGFKPAYFQADSALLRELGERLVGQPHIALAELIKNAYDADALLCTVELGVDTITISDNGHGMSAEEFLGYWMVIGTRHKQGASHSRKLGRSVTGSKGVGRLSAQFLAHELEIQTVSDSDPDTILTARVNWDTAIDAGSLTQAKALYRIDTGTIEFPGRSRWGTKITLRRLKQGWDTEAITNLARQLWRIQPPLAQHFGRTKSEKPDPRAFAIEFESANTAETELFKRQMSVALDNWHAVISGEIRNEAGKRKSSVTVIFRDNETFSEDFDLDPPLVQDVKWIIRVYSLQGRQMDGVKVGEAREYFQEFGGVLVYDAGFRLPYYGSEQDWLDIEFDHSHRLSRSELLPEALQVKRALNDLPSQGRLFGVVRIDTARELASAGPEQKDSGEYLKIQVSRDRLVPNQAFQVLRNAVRQSLDYYATRQRLREDRRQALRKPKESSDERVGRARTLVAEIRAEYPDDDLITELDKELATISKTVTAEREFDEASRSLLGPLASAGMAMLAIEHESRKELRVGRTLVKRLRTLAVELGEPRLTDTADALSTWVDRLEAMRKLFSPLLDAEDRESIEAFRVRPLLRQVVDNVQILVPSVDVSIVAEDGLTLPPGTFAEWNSLFQNVIVNAANATLDEADRRVRCSAGSSPRQAWVRISDNGVGIDLEQAPGFFEPFARSMHISEERERLGLGGLGLGLTIVRMIASQRRCRAEFVPPEPGFSTTFQLSWGRAQ